MPARPTSLCAQLICAFLVLVVPQTTAAQTRPASQPPPSPGTAPKDAPLETEVSGFARAPKESDGAGRQAARIVLYPVRGVWWVAMAPFRGLAYAFNRFQLKERYQEIFFSDDLTRGLVPNASFQSGLGITAGASFKWNDIERTGASLQLGLAYGGEFVQSYSGRLRSGQWLSDFFSLELEGQFREYPNARFFGIGNNDADLQSPNTVSGLVDPLADSTAVATRFRHDTLHTSLGGRFQLTQDLDLLLSSAYRRRLFEDNVIARDDARIDEVYDVTRLTGYERGLSNVYSEASLTLDRRVSLERYHSSAAPSTGYYINGFYGFQVGVNDADPSEHGRWGVDLQRYFDVYRGDRTLVLRLYVEGVTGSLEEVPFIDLPTLGGPIFLRGYRRDRFRARNIGLASIEYQYPISRNLRGYLFVDAGAPFNDFDELENWPSTPRIAYGGGLQIHTIHSFIGRLVVGSNIDGGFQLTFSFDPTFETNSREDDL